MKITINILIALCLMALLSCRQKNLQQQAMADDGKKVELYSDGTWKYSDSNNVSNFNSNADNGDKFIGNWRGERGGEWNVAITKNGDYYQWDDGGHGIGKVQLKYKDGELQNSGMGGNVTYNKTNGRIYFFGSEFKKIQ
jgi:hypothetical protein